MAHDLQLFNNKINQDLINKNVLNNYKHYVIPFNDYEGLYNLLHQNRKASSVQLLKIYDYTIGLKSPGELFPVNDHINRIGHNPFIGKQQFFNIDFINIENLYLQNKTGITTTCYGNRYATRNTTAEFPSTYIANIATLAHIHEYTITGHLINQI